MQSTLTRYSTTLLPLAILVLGVLDAANKAGANLWGWQTITQIVILLATTGAAYWLPLVPGPWAGALKTGAGIVGAVASAAVATIPNGGEFTSATLILFLTAAIKAVATELGVQIRQDAAKLVDARDTPAGQVPVITSIVEPDSADVAPILDPADHVDEDDEDPAEVGAGDVLVPNDGLGTVAVDETPSRSTPGPDHRAE